MGTEKKRLTEIELGMPSKYCSRGRGKKVLEMVTGSLWGNGRA